MRTNERIGCLNQFRTPSMKKLIVLLITLTLCILAGGSIISCRVKSKAENGREATAVTVNVNDEITIKLKETKTITAVIQPNDATNQNLIWESGNENVLTVSPTSTVGVDGVSTVVLTAVGEGTTTLKATKTTKSSIFKLIEVEVVRTIVNSIELDIVETGVHYVATTDPTDQSLYIFKLPSGTNISALSPIIKTKKTGITNTPNVGQNFQNAPQNTIEYTLTDDNGTQLDRIKIKVVVAPSNYITVTSVKFLSADNQPYLTADFEAQESLVNGVATYTATIPKGTDLSKLKPYIQTDANVLFTPLLTAEQDFSAGKTVSYLLTSPNKNPVIIKIKVDIVDFNAPITVNSVRVVVESVNYQANISTVNGVATYTAAIPFGSDISALTPVIESEVGVTVAPAHPQNFESAPDHTIDYTLSKAGKGDLVIKIKVTKQVAEVITVARVLANSIEAVMSPPVEGGVATYIATVPYSTNISSIILFIERESGVIVAPAIAGSQNFQNATDNTIEYTLTKAGKADLVIKVKVVKLAPGIITVNKVSVNNVVAMASVVDGGVATYTATVPYSTNTSALNPVIESDTYLTIAPDITKPQNFANAPDNTIEYTLSNIEKTNLVIKIKVVKQAPGIITINKVLVNNVVAVASVVDGGVATYTATVPYSTNISALKPVIESDTYLTIAPDITKPQNFANAPDNTIEYTLSNIEKANLVIKIKVVKLAPGIITVNKVSVNNVVAVKTVVDGAIIYTVTLPFGTDISSITPTIESEADIAIAPAQPQNFANAPDNTIEYTLSKIEKADLKIRIMVVVSKNAKAELTEVIFFPDNTSTEETAIKTGLQFRGIFANGYFNQSTKYVKTKITISKGATVSFVEGETTTKATLKEMADKGNNLVQYTYDNFEYFRSTNVILRVTSEDNKNITDYTLVIDELRITLIEFKDDINSFLFRVMASLNNNGFSITLPAFATVSNIKPTVTFTEGATLTPASEAKVDFVKVSELVYTTTYTLSRGKYSVDYLLRVNIGNEPKLEFTTLDQNGFVTNRIGSDDLINQRPVKLSGVAKGKYKVFLGEKFAEVTVDSEGGNAFNVKSLFATDKPNVYVHDIGTNVNQFSVAPTDAPQSKIVVNNFLPALDLYRITSVAELKAFRYCTGDAFLSDPKYSYVGSAEAEFQKTITLEIDLLWDSNEKWEPLPVFAGIFDGRGQSITGLNIEAGGNVGFFSELRGYDTKKAQVKWLNLTNITVKNSVSEFTSGPDSYKNNNTGGIVGYMGENSILTRCVVSTSPKPFSFTSESRTSDIRCSIQGNFAVGGLVGGCVRDKEININQCAAFGIEVKPAFDYAETTKPWNYSAGGIVGKLGGVGQLSDCYLLFYRCFNVKYRSTELNATIDVGGGALAGSVWDFNNGNVTIQNCYVITPDKWAESNGMVAEYYFQDEGQLFVKLFVGTKMNINGITELSQEDMLTTGSIYCSDAGFRTGGGMRSGNNNYVISYEEMKHTNYYVGWDQMAIWTISEGSIPYQRSIVF